MYAQRVASDTPVPVTPAPSPAKTPQPAPRCPPCPPCNYNCYSYGSRTKLFFVGTSFRDGDICHDTNSIACDSNESTCQAECDHAKALSERNLSAVIDQGNVQLAANRVFRFRSVHKRDFNAIITTISVFFNLRFTNYARTETHVGVNVSGFNDGTSCLCFCSC
ncbi:hypothetical protein FI667_g9210, partial [Globisporangium splendens]